MTTGSINISRMMHPPTNTDADKHFDRALAEFLRRRDVSPEDLKKYMDPIVATELLQKLEDMKLVSPADAAGKREALFDLPFPSKAIADLPDVALKNFNDNYDAAMAQFIWRGKASASILVNDLELSSGLATRMVHEMENLSLISEADPKTGLHEVISFSPLYKDAAALAAGGTLSEDDVKNALPDSPALAKMLFEDLDAAGLAQKPAPAPAPSPASGASPPPPPAPTAGTGAGTGTGTGTGTTPTPGPTPTGARTGSGDDADAKQKQTVGGSIWKGFRWFTWDIRNNWVGGAMAVISIIGTSIWCCVTGGNFDTYRYKTYEEIEKDFKQKEKNREEKKTKEQATPTPTPTPVNKGALQKPANNDLHKLFSYKNSVSAAESSSYLSKTEQGYKIVVQKENFDHEI